MPMEESQEPHARISPSAESATLWRMCVSLVDVTANDCSILTVAGNKKSGATETTPAANEPMPRYSLAINYLQK